MGSINKCSLPVSGLRFVTIILVAAALRPVNAESPVADCGTIDPIVAEYDPRAQVPWTAALYFQSTQCDFRPAGNGHGVILGPTTVLIRGNFMWTNNASGGPRMESYSPNHFIVVVGLKSKLPFVADQHTQFLKVANIQPHYLSYDAYSDHDYAIVHLKNPIQYTSFVRPLCVDIVPEGMFDRTNSSLLNDHLTITGFRTGAKNPSSALHADKEPFGLLSPEYCSSKLKSDLTKSPNSIQLLDVNTPCGISTKGVEDSIDVRIIGRRGEMILAFLKRLLNFTHLETTKGPRPIQNACYHNGAAVVTMYQGKWHLIGLVTESLGMTCEKNLYFVSFVASKSNINWISQHLRNSPSGFICSNGQNINLERNLCNGVQDCVDGSDEEDKVCACAPMCSNPHCVLQPKCRHCPVSDSLRVLAQTYNFSTADTPAQRNCPPVKPPQGATVYCKAPGIKSRFPCDHHHFPGTQAVYTCEQFDSATPASYCVTTCREDGTWTDEINFLKCKLETEEIRIAERANLSAQALPINNGITETPAPLNPAHLPLTTTSSVSGWGDDKPITFDPKYSMMCPPLHPKIGAEIYCWSSTNSSSKSNCTQPQPAGTKAIFTCKRFYTSAWATASVTKVCQDDGQWSLSNRNFECRLDCGIPKSDLVGHIVNGRETEGAKHPWHALLFINVAHGQQQRNLTYICGATLISKRILITAAHCVTDRYGEPRNVDIFRVVLAATSNTYHKNLLVNEYEAQTFDVSAIRVHQYFNIQTFEADIAIMQLAKPAEINEFVRPVCYPSTKTANTHAELKHLSPGSVGKVVGFGYDETGQPSTTLKEASLPVVSYVDCFNVSKIQHSSTQYCAGYTNGTSACNGDSGGGNYFVDEVPERRIFLQGIVSHGNKDETSRFCDHNQYSVFTRVASFKNWISEVGYELDEEF